MIATTLKNLKDNSEFFLNLQRLRTKYTLLRLDKKTKTATFESQRSHKTLEKDWETKCFIKNH